MFVQYIGSSLMGCAFGPAARPASLQQLDWMQVPPTFFQMSGLSSKSRDASDEALETTADRHRAVEETPELRLRLTGKERVRPSDVVGVFGPGFNQSLFEQSNTRNLRQKD